MQCKKNKYETVILLSLIMKPNKYLMNNAIVIVPSDPTSPTNIHRFLCKSSRLPNPTSLTIFHHFFESSHLGHTL